MKGKERSTKKQTNKQQTIKINKSREEEGDKEEIKVPVTVVVSGEFTLVHKKIE